MAVADRHRHRPATRDHPTTAAPTGPRRAAAALTPLLALVMLAAACDAGSGDRGRTAATTAPPTAATTASGTASIPVPGGAPAAPTARSSQADPSGPAPADRQAEEQIARDWQRFFDPRTPLAARAALLENGDRLKPVLRSFSGDSRTGRIRAEVTTVAFTSPDSATVTYTLTLGADIVLPGATGRAVLRNGSWKVSQATLCDLVTQGGTAGAVPGCA